MNYDANQTLVPTATRCAGSRRTAPGEDIRQVKKQDFLLFLAHSWASEERREVVHFPPQILLYCRQVAGTPRKHELVCSR